MADAPTWLSAIATTAAVAVSTFQWVFTNRRERRMTEAAEKRAETERQRQITAALADQFQLYDAIVSVADAVTNQVRAVLDNNRSMVDNPNFGPGPYQTLHAGDAFRQLIPFWVPHVRDETVLRAIMAIQRQTLPIPFPEHGAPGRGRVWFQQIEQRHEVLEAYTKSLRDHVERLRKEAGLDA